MMKAAFFGILIAVALPAMAAPSDEAAGAKVATDIRVSESRARVVANDSGDYIELAQAYLRAGKTGEAALAYRAALARDNVMMVTRYGDSIWSHEVARMALKRVPQLASK